MKQFIKFHVSMCSLIISMDKPFNPILGETYEGTIDGCPIMLEQISHYPPILSFLFLGRGYKIYGVLEPKIQLKMNSGVGWNPHFSTIEFDDGGKIEFTLNKMGIYGLLFGDRIFNF